MTVLTANGSFSRIKAPIASDNKIDDEEPAGEAIAGVSASPLNTAKCALIVDLLDRLWIIEPEGRAPELLAREIKMDSLQGEDRLSPHQLQWLFFLN
ncbi:hypothetical protein [Nitrosospira multiformis]|uniref:hypothetical protein n=1 Tax=Nitrosospira multiformis TaxID=1231 RepID=UPI0011B1F492|nr:hypothetical protein [Nitrosospira multiformis]